MRARGLSEKDTQMSLIKAFLGEAVEVSPPASV
nr:hypothetical protein [Bradyrhizobium nanningense]